MRRTKENQIFWNNK